MQKVSNNVQSNLLLNLKDIESVKASNVNSKLEQKAKTIDASLEKYNANVVKAFEAPVPEITLPFTEVLLRAVPLEIKSKAGIILTTGGVSDFQMADKLERMSEAIDQVQEILMVGEGISEEEREKRGIKPGRICKFRLDRFRTISDRHQNGMIQTEYKVPSEEIDGYKYLIIDQRDIIYTKEM